jgi:uncharacterized protein YndB with AHSA1/START domain
MSRFPIGPAGRVLDDAGGRRLVPERTFHAPIAGVWATLTEPDRFARWYGPMEGAAAPGRTITVTMVPENEIVALPATILECEPPRRFVLDLGDPQQPWRISVDLVEDGGVTRMTFDQALDGGEIDIVEVGPGWEYYADRLTAALEDTAMPDWDADGYQDALGPHYAASS